MEYIVGRLITGEMVVSMVGELTGDVLQLICPFEIIKEKTYENEEVLEKTLLKPLCPYTNESVVPIMMERFVYLSPLKPELCQIYKSLVDAYETADGSTEQASPEESLNTFYVDPVNTIQ